MSEIPIALRHALNAMERCAEGLVFERETYRREAIHNAESCDEWKQTAEDIFREACDVEAERDEADACVALLVACLADAEREIEEQAAEMVALWNERDCYREGVGRANERWVEAHRDFKDCNADREDACRQLAAAIRERDSYRRAYECVKERMDRHDGECERLARERDEATTVANSVTRELVEANAELERKDQIALELLRERDEMKMRLDDALLAGSGALTELDDVKRALEQERAAHQVTARRLAHLTETD